MAKLPYMRIYVNDLFGDTQTLSDGEFGSYVAILMAMWKAGGWLTQDQARKASRCAAGRWGKRWAELAGYFEIEDDGRITHARVREDLSENGRLDDRRSLHEPKKVVAAETKNHVAAETTKSRPKRLKTNEPTPPASRALAQSHIPEGREVEESPSELPQPAAVVVLHPTVARDDWPTGDPNELARRLCLHSGGKLDMAKELQLVTSVGYVGAWKRAGFSWALDVLPAVEALKRGKQRPRTWAYLDPIVRENAARRLHAERPLDPSETPQGDRYDRQPASKQLGNLANAFAARERLAALVEERGGGGGEFD